MSGYTVCVRDDAPIPLDEILSLIHHKLIVSCQALPHEPLYGAEIMARMASAAVRGGAAAVRANTPSDIAAIRMAVDVPIIGLWKVDIPGYEVYITPRIQDALAIADAGADVIALDATDRPHPEGTAAEFVQSVKRATGLPVMADIATIAEGIAAHEAGADLISTTMSGYTPQSAARNGPDLELVEALARRIGHERHVIAEGRIATPEMMRAELDAGAFAVVVGGAITRPQQIAERFAAFLPIA